MPDERRQIRAKIREYEKDGEKKNFYATIGTAWVSEHGTKIKLQLDSVPVNWDGVAFVNEIENKTHDFNKKVYDVAPKDIDDKVSLKDIPF